MNAEIPDPVCEHNAIGRVTAGDLGGTHASVYVCAELDCIAAAMAWASAQTGLEAAFFPFNPRVAS